MALLYGAESRHVPDVKSLLKIDETTVRMGLKPQYNTVAKWYFKEGMNIGDMEASQSASAGSPPLIKSATGIKIPLRSSSIEKSFAWVLVFIKFSEAALQNLQHYKKKSTTNTVKLQSIEITVDVIENNDKVQSINGTVSISEVLDKRSKLDVSESLALQLPTQVILIGDRKLDMHLSAELQVRQAGGFTLERVDIVDSRENLANVVNISRMKANGVSGKSTNGQPPRTATQMIDTKLPTGAFMTNIPIRESPASKGPENRPEEVQPLNLIGSYPTAHPTIHSTAPDFPRKWYLSDKEDTVITTQTECAPFLVLKTISVELDCIATQSSTVSITVNLKFPGSLLQQLEKFAKTYRSTKTENKEHALNDLQSIKVEAQVKGQAKKITETRSLTDISTYEMSWPLNDELVLNNTSTVVVNIIPGIQVTQGHGFEVVSIELLDRCPMPSLPRPCSGASSTILALTPIEAYMPYANSSEAHVTQASPSKTTSSQSDSSQVSTSQPASLMSNPPQSSTTWTKAIPQKASKLKPPQLSKPKPKSSLVFRYKVSKSGTRLITFSFHNERRYMCLWDISTAAQDPGPGGGEVRIDVNAGSTQHDRSNCLASMDTEDQTMKLNFLDERIEIALSYDGSQVVLVPVDVKPLPAPSPQFFKCDLKNEAIDSTVTPSELVSFVGYGDFHTTLRDGKDPDTQHELFLACDGLSVFVFSSPTDGTWTKLREIHLVKPPACIDSLSISDLFNHVVNKVRRRSPARTMPSIRPDPDFVAAEKLIRSIRNQHFAWTGHSKVVSVWNLVSGRMVSHVYLDGGNEGQIRKIHAHMSVDGSVLAVWYEEKKCVETYWTATGIQTRRFLCSRLIRGQFVAPDPSLKPSKPPLDVFDWTKAPLALQLCNYEYWRINTSAEGKQVFTYLIRTPSLAIKVQALQTVFAQLGSKPNQTTGAATSLRIDSETTQNGCLDDPHGDCRFTFEYIRKFNKAVCTIQWKGTDHHAKPLIKFIVTFQSANVYFQEGKLVLEADSFILGWKLPQKKDDTCRLILCWSREQGQAGSTGSAQQDKNTFGSERYQDNDLHHEDIRSDMELNRECAVRFMGGIPILLKMLENARLSDQDDYARGSIGFAIVGYLGAFINHNPTSDSPRNSVMAELCSGLTQANKLQLKNLVHQILREKKKWSPLPQYPTYKSKDKKDMPSCPFGILYMLDNRGMDVKALVKKLYRHCMEQAESTGNIHYLAPVFDSLTDFLKVLPKDASESLRRISIIKRTDSDFITTNHFDGCRYNFQSNIERDGDKDEGRRAYYVASTGILWRHRFRQESGYEESVTIESPWHRILPRLIAYKLNPLCHNYIQCHDYVQHCNFETNVFDNPGIEAVIGQRWNIAQFYWLSGFVVQCLLFFLIFLAIIARDTDSLFISGWDCGFFIFIFIVSGLLLWSEVSWIWKPHSKGIRYDNSGLFIFAVPLASCVLELFQMRFGIYMLGISLSFGSYLLGISLVLIGLQLLFELRVYQCVCKFYLILLNFMSNFMTSLIISFLAVFTVVVTTSHLLCTFIEDMQANGIHVIFSSHSGAPSMDVPMNTPLYSVRIFVAISVLMPFTIYTLLPFILYFATGFLEEIHAVTENDVMHMWNENRLPYVIGAENLTYVVPGLRDKLGYSNLIYFRMTKANELEYNKRQKERVVSVDQVEGQGAVQNQSQGLQTTLASVQG